MTTTQTTGDMWSKMTPKLWRTPVWSRCVCVCLCVQTHTHAHTRGIRKWGQLTFILGFKVTYFYLRIKQNVIFLHVHLSVQEILFLHLNTKNNTAILKHCISLVTYFGEKVLTQYMYARPIFQYEYNSTGQERGKWCPKSNLNYWCVLAK